MAHSRGVVGLLYDNKLRTKYFGPSVEKSNVLLIFDRKRGEITAIFETFRSAGNRSTFDYLLSNCASTFETEIPKTSSTIIYSRQEQRPMNSNRSSQLNRTDTKCSYFYIALKYWPKDIV